MGSANPRSFSRGLMLASPYSNVSASKYFDMLETLIKIHIRQSAGCKKPQRLSICRERKNKKALGVGPIYIGERISLKSKYDISYRNVG